VPEYQLLFRILIFVNKERKKAFFPNVANEGRPQTACALLKISFFSKKAIVPDLLGQ
jgi:hypothetical protein